MSCAAFMADTTRVYEERGRKPKTKLQQKCLELVKTLPPLTDAQKRWIKSKMTPLGYYVRRGRGGKHSAVWCQECGQMDEVGLPPLAVDLKITKHVCSRCGKKLSVQPWVASKNRKEVEHNFQAGIITTCEDMQVVRMFNCYQWNMMGRETTEHIDEVFSVWVDVKTGKETIVSKPYTRSFYYFRWKPTGEYRIARHNGGCSGYYVSEDTFDVSRCYFYPRKKVQPILKRNGWSNEMARMKTGPVQIWRALLTDPTVEGLAKTKQYSVMDYWFMTGDPNKDKGRWLPMVKICNRGKYIIEDASIWFDVLDALDKLGMDKRNPKYICPQNLIEMHNWLQMRIDRKNVKEELRKLNSQAKDWEGYYKETKGVYFPIVFDNGSIFCHVITSVAEMCEEGTRMHHCVYKMKYYKKPESLILSARDKEGKRLETVEVSLKTFKVLQSRGLQNNPTRAHNEIISLVEKNMNLIRTAARRQIITK